MALSSGLSLVVVAAASLAFADELVEAISPTYLREQLHALSGHGTFVLDGKEQRIRERGSPEGRELARQYLKREYEKLGYTVRIEKKETSAGTAWNVIAEKDPRKSGKPEGVLVISSHYDSEYNAGADDDATGTAAALAIAKSFAKSKDSMQLRFVAFDLEEKGLAGSIAHVENLESLGQLGQIAGVLQMEMFGHDGNNDGKFHIINCDLAHSSGLSKAIKDAVGQTQSGLTVVPACTDRSDHQSFWEKDIPAVVVSQNFFGGDYNPCYHRQCDTVDKINFPYMLKLTRVVGQAVTNLLGAGAIAGRGARDDLKGEAPAASGEDAGQGGAKAAPR